MAPPSRDRPHASTGSVGLVGVALRVAGTELRSSLRDRQAIIYTVVLPLALYPLLFWILLQGWLLLQGREEHTEVRVALVAPPAGADRQRWIEALEAPDDGKALQAPGPLSVVPVDDRPGEAELAARLRERPAGEEGRLDAVLVLAQAQGSRLLFDSTRSRSDLAARRVEERLGLLARALRHEATGVTWEGLRPFHVERHDLASAEDTSGFVLSFILPMTFVIMAVMGSFFPAVDCTAGEKERGTAETTLLLPVPRVAVVLGKVTAVAASGLVATTLNLVGLLLAAEYLLSGLEDADGIRFDVPWRAFPLAAPLLLLFLVSTAALLVALASLTATFKQGQSLMGGVQMLFIFPAILVAMPGIELTAPLALVPVVQTVLAFKEILQLSAGVGSGLALELTLVALSQAAYALLAVRFAARLATREALLLGGGPSIRRLFALLRTGGAPR